MSTWIQLCGPLVIRLDGRRREQELPGRQGRQLAAYLIAHRARAVPRDELVDALWRHDVPDGAQDTLSTLLSRVRRALGAGRLEGRAALRIVLPPDAFVDLEAADAAIHEAESAIAQRAWSRAWAPARIALSVANRGFLVGLDGHWIEEHGRHVENLRLRALEAVAAGGLGVGGSELPSVERAARALIEAAPFRETGHRYLMRYFEARDDLAEALQVYERLRVLLRDELGVAPGAAAQALHRHLLMRTVSPRG
jgi:SARP family transcriptional regulator, regulator of embCAB operon